VGKTTWEVMNARKKLVVEWEPISDTKDKIGGRGGTRDVVVPGGLESTSAHFEKMQEYANKPAQLLRKDGDPETAFKNAAQIIERTYNAPFLAHNCMEPINFFAHVTDEKALVAGPLQTPGWSEPTLCKSCRQSGSNGKEHCKSNEGHRGTKDYRYKLNRDLSHTIQTGADILSKAC
jgi:isoquinoline 1-oxidoreductase subunit beta